MSVDLSPVRKFFWDVDAGSITWEQHSDFIVRRILQRGDDLALRWLRARLGDAGLRDWIVQHNARGLSPRQIRYWALILEIEPALADEWVARIADLPWEKRRG